jgi:hypothetical protein
MDLEYEYLKAKEVTEKFENKLLEKHKIQNLDSLFFELRKRTQNVKAEINTVEFNINGYFDNLILGHIKNRSCNWFMYIHDYSKNILQNEKLENKISITMMYKSEFSFQKWFSNLDEGLKYVQEYYLTKKEDFEFSAIFQTYYLKLNDILSNKEDYIL